MRLKSSTCSERGFTLVELMIVVGIISVLAALATAQLLRARAAANEGSTIASLRAISSSQFAYANACGGGRYATDLVTLGTSTPGSTVPFLSPDLTSASVIQKSDYEIIVTAGAAAAAGGPDCNGTPTSDGYYASGRPLMFGFGGSRSFAMTTTGVIWQELAANPPVEPFSAPATPIN